MADEDRQPPQSYDTVAPAGVGATTSNQVSPGTIQEILDTRDSTLIDQAFDQMTVEDMIAYVEQLPSPPAFRASSPAGVGSSGSQSFRSPQATPDSSGARTPATPPSVPLAAAGARTARVLGVMGADVVDVAVDVVVDVAVVDVVVDVAVVLLVLVVVVVVEVLVAPVAAVAAAVVVVVVVVVEGVVVDDARDAYEDDDEIPPRRL